MVMSRSIIYGDREQSGTGILMEGAEGAAEP